MGRFIPTGVGNTINYKNPQTGKPVHPHGRGEHSSTSINPASTAGSSPRAWGTQFGQSCHSLRSRFIPTGVGNTLAGIFSITISSVHPHGRGEHYKDHRTVVWCRGSSPRAWGTPISESNAPRRSRFIPTGVGNTAHAWVAYAVDTVHPHGRGEHCGLGSLGPWRNGSSPRAWGTPGFHQIVCQCVRFIPTGVGNTSAWAASAASLRSGSSPRAWGTPSHPGVR